MYEQVQKRSSEWSATSTPKSNQYGPSSFSVQRQSNKKSNPLPARREYSTAARDALAAKIMRTLAADGIREEAAPNQIAELAMNKDVPATTKAEAIQTQQDSSSGKVMLPIQAKLTIGAPGDKYEQEADRVAEQVMQMPEPEPLNQALTVERQATRSLNPMSISRQRRLGAFEAQPIPEGLQRKCAACEEDEAVQMKSSLQLSADGGLQASSDIESQLSRSQGGGSPLSDEVRGFMEPRFGHNFSKVRVHNDSTAVQMNRELGAQAFAHGSDIYFGAGKSPGNNELTAHELTHVVQQTGGVQMMQTPDSSVQMKCSACETEEVEVQRSLSISIAPNLIQRKLFELLGTDAASCKEKITEDTAICADQINTTCAVGGAAATGAAALGAAGVGSGLGSLFGPGPGTAIGAGVGLLAGTVVGGIGSALLYGECVKGGNARCRAIGKQKAVDCDQEFSTTGNQQPRDLGEL